jgi:hypothetical protein
VPARVKAPGRRSCRIARGEWLGRSRCASRPGVGVLAGTAADMQIMSLVDGLSVQAAARGRLDYTGVRTLVAAVTEQILGLRFGA